jgi:hypothetical protein
VINASDGFYDDEELLIDLFEDFGYDDDVDNYRAGDDVPEIDDVVPGTVITKEPYVQNTSDLDAYVAMKIVLNDSAIDYTTIDWNTTDWTFVDVDANTKVAYYNGVLGAATIDSATGLPVATVTNNVFNTVTVTSTLADATMDDATQITIDLTGYAVQG